MFRFAAMKPRIPILIRRRACPSPEPSPRSRVLERLPLLNRDGPEQMHAWTCTRPTLRTQRRVIALVALIMLPVFAIASYKARPNSEDAFLAANDAAMSRMMRAMTISPSGDVDRDFVAMMVPHHQGAIDMAHAVLEHGADARLKRIAQEIIVTQQEEIVAMQRIVETLPTTKRADGGAP
jgi:DUF305 family protein family protein